MLEVKRDKKQIKTMQTEPNAKQQIVERIKNSTNILVTVGANPSVDELSAALALSLMLNRMDKHATAVFSGAIPPAIEFLEPQKTFEPTVDSLRDFIIALDKEKADRLRYKVEDDVVRVFITPYKTIITEKDLQFSQGDFNVELVIALGVEKREDLDVAITAHGRILHDATVVTINATANEPNGLGAVDWTDAGSSSLCEMLMSLSESLQSGLLDQQIATALLTGIVAATDRFRNEHTSPRVMTMSAQLMAAGANQQLIATKLEAGYDLAPQTVQPDGSVPLVEDASAKVERSSSADGTMEISHLPEPITLPEPTSVDEASLEAAITPSLSPTLSVSELQNDLAQASEEINDASDQLGGDDPDHPMIKKEHRSWRTDASDGAPSFGGTLNATAADAEEAKRKEEELRSTQQMLSHDMPTGGSDPFAPPPTTFDAPVMAYDPADDMLSAPLAQATTDDALSYEEAQIPVAVPAELTLADIDAQARGKATDDARAAVEAALGSAPFDLANQPLESSGALPGVEVSHTQPIDQLSSAYAVDQVAPEDEMLPSTSPEPALAPPSLPPLPDFSTLPPLPGELPAESVEPAMQQPMSAPPATSPEPALAPPATDPGQFRIPGQQ